MADLAELLVALFIVIGGVFGLVGSVGLLKLTDQMSRLHAPTKATTLGVGGVLIAALLSSWLLGPAGSFHELLITIFLFLTAPVTAHFIAKAHIHRRITAAELPKADGDEGWAVLSAAPEGSAAQNQTEAQDRPDAPVG